MPDSVTEHVLALVMQPPVDGLGGAGGEALGAARAAADQFGLPLACALIGHGVSAAAVEAAERGADRVLVAGAEHLARFSGDVAVPLAAAAIEACEARTIVVARGPDALELAPRLAARLGGASVMGATALHRAADGGLEVEAAVFGGAARALYRMHASPRIVGVGAAVAEAPARSAGRAVEIESLDAPPPESERVRVLEQAQPSAGPRLEDARVVVAGGRGLRDGEHYALVRELAQALGGVPGASRAIVDDGWADATDQVGLTGAIVAPDLYVAAGISGASQHMAGCSNARLIVAINTDAQAPIFRYAHYGIVDDCLEVLPELISLCRQRAARP